MKLAKLSLAAIIAAGAFSVANATSLEDAIKGVDLGGMVRIRFYNNDYKKSTSKQDYNRWRTSTLLKFTLPVDNAIKVHVDYGVEGNVYSNGNTLTGGTSKTKPSPVELHAFLQYSANGANVILGKIPVATSVTGHGYGEALGAGAIATYGLGNGFTVAGGWVDATDNLDQLGTTGADIAAVAALYNSDMVSAQVWGYRVTNVAKHVYTISATVKPMAGVALHGDYASGKLYGTNQHNHNYWNLSGSYAANGFNAKVGYASTNKKNGVVVLDNDAPISAVLGVDQVYAMANMTDTDAWYAGVGYNVDAKTHLYANYANINQSKNAGDTDDDEYMFGAKYKYNKKLAFNVLYDVLDYKRTDVGDNKEFKFEAKYIF